MALNSCMVISCSDKQCRDSIRHPKGHLDSCIQLISKATSAPREAEFINGVWIVDSVIFFYGKKQYDDMLYKNAVDSSRLEVHYPCGYFLQINAYYKTESSGTIDSLYTEERISGGEQSADEHLKGTSYYYGYEDERTSVNMIVLKFGAAEYYFERLSNDRIGYFFAGSYFIFRKIGSSQ